MPKKPRIPGEERLRATLIQYRQSFSAKTYEAENNDRDILMDVFGISPELKRENRQYWGRELGMCWQLIVNTVADFEHGIREGQDELCDLVAGKDAIDTKYRIGSGDSGTLKKFKHYGRVLRDRGFRPVLLIVRTDNLGAAMTACQVGGWQIFTSKECFDYIREKTRVNLLEWFRATGEEFRIAR